MAKKDEQMNRKKEKRIGALARKNANLTEYTKMLTSGNVSLQITERKIRKEFKGSNKDYLLYLIKTVEKEIDILKLKI